MTKTAPLRGELPVMSAAWEACPFPAEPRYCSLEHYDKELPDHPLVQFVAGRQVLQQVVWESQTAHPAYRSISPTTKAYGQCVPSCADLFEEAREHFPNENLSLESGFVYAQMRERKSLLQISSHVHVWLQWLPEDSEGKLRNFYAIDPTGSQIPTSYHPIRLVENLHELAVQQGVIYQSIRRFFDLESFYDQFSIGEPDVQQRVNTFRERVNQLANASLPAAYQTDV